jgi:hypothetical protein
MRSGVDRSQLLQIELSASQQVTRVQPAQFIVEFMSVRQCAHTDPILEVDCVDSVDRRRDGLIVTPMITMTRVIPMSAV